MKRLRRAAFDFAVTFEGTVDGIAVVEMGRVGLTHEDGTGEMFESALKGGAESGEAPVATSSLRVFAGADEHAPFGAREAASVDEEIDAGGVSFDRREATVVLEEFVDAAPSDAREAEDVVDAFGAAAGATPPLDGVDATADLTPPDDTSPPTIVTGSFFDVAVVFFEDSDEEFPAAADPPFFLLEPG